MSEFSTQLETQIAPLRRYALALARDPARVDDLVQSCLLRALANKHRWRPDTDLRAWLFTILHNLHVSDIRRTARARRGLDAIAAFAIKHCEPTPVIELVDLNRAMAKLPEYHRRAVLLVGRNDMSYGQAAAVLGVPVGTVRSRIGRARAALRRLTDNAPPMATRRALRPAA